MIDYLQILSAFVVKKILYYVPPLPKDGEGHIVSPPYQSGVGEHIVFGTDPVGVKLLVRSVT